MLLISKLFFFIPRRNGIMFLTHQNYYRLIPSLLLMWSGAKYTLLVNRQGS